MIHAKATYGLPNAKELRTKVRLAASLNAILAERKLTQAEASRLLRVESAEGFGAEGIQAGGVFGGAADALRYGAGARCGDRDSSAGGGEGCGAGISREVVELSGCSFTHSSGELFRSGSRDWPIR